MVHTYISLNCFYPLTFLGVNAVELVKDLQNSSRNCGICFVYYNYVCPDLTNSKDCRFSLYLTGSKMFSDQ
ncbi:hypothetical protein FRX31_014098 [Thalictrum thalictroides]|uniref:Uncharacterized protein n=1 Tax=Thalictrum thalictroides TaxID=46969 RepID=A0A7J6WIP5_THATH|nr:hypothetical protein FRX31_014098 [Thalictrum thalictroides]